MALHFVSILCVAGDWMHTMHLGVLQYAFGSVLWLLAFDILPGTPADNMRDVMRQLRFFWKYHPTPGHFQGITLNMFSVANDPEGKYPKLKGQAGEIKHLGPALLFVFRANHRQGFLQDIQTFLMLEKFCRLDAILDDHPSTVFPRLPLAAAAEFERVAFEAASLQNALAAYYSGPPDPKPLFNITIKSHYMVHIAVMAKFSNPRISMCYGGEDYMKHMKQLVAASIRGMKAADVSKKLADKQAAAMHIEMTPRR
jgi:hypothetical protein